MSSTLLLACLSLLAASAAAASAPPPPMKAVVAGGYEPSINATVIDKWLTNKARPRAGRKQLLIRINTSSVNPCDVDLITSKPEAEAAKLFRKTLGFDVSGVVVAAGADCARIKVGDAVWSDLGEFGLREGIAEMGAWAQYAVADEEQAGLAPTSLSLEQAGTLPLVGLTSLESLQLAGAPWPAAAKKSVVVTSGQGGTGITGVQLAKALGATRVVTACDAAHLKFCRELGADSVVDFRQTTIFAGLKDNSVDVVYDNFGSKGNADAAMRVLRPGGFFIAVQGSLSGHPKAGVTQKKVDLRYKDPCCEFQ